MGSYAIYMVRFQNRSGVYLAVVEMSQMGRSPDGTVLLQILHFIDHIYGMNTVGDVEDYLKHLYSQIGGVPENITQVRCRWGRESQPPTE